MASVKFTEQGQQLRLDRLASLRETRKDLYDLAGLKKSPEWAKLIRLLRRWEDFAKREESHANAAHDSEDISSEVFGRRVTRARQKAADFAFVAEVLDKREDQIKLVDEEIAKVESAYKTAKEVLA